MARKPAPKPSRPIAAPPATHPSGSSESQEMARAQETLRQAPDLRMHINEGGRTTESDAKGNPREAMEGRLPAVAERETGR